MLAVPVWSTHPLALSPSPEENESPSANVGGRAGRSQPPGQSCRGGRAARARLSSSGRRPYLGRRAGLGGRTRQCCANQDGADRREENPGPIWAHVTRPPTECAAIYRPPALPGSAIRDRCANGRVADLANLCRTSVCSARGDSSAEEGALRGRSILGCANSRAAPDTPVANAPLRRRRPGSWDPGLRLAVFPLPLRPALDVLLKVDV